MKKCSIQIVVILLVCSILTVPVYADLVMLENIPNVLNQESVTACASYAMSTSLDILGYKIDPMYLHKKYFNKMKETNDKSWIEVLTEGIQDEGINVSFRRLSSPSSIKHAIDSGNPVIAVWQEPKHAAVIIGYCSRYVIYQNSWGIKWGNKGKGRLYYDAYEVNLLLFAYEIMVDE